MAVAVAVGLLVLGLRTAGVAGHPWTALLSGAVAAPFVTAWRLSVELLKSAERPILAGVVDRSVVPVIMTLFAAALLLAVSVDGGEEAAMPIALAYLAVPASYAIAATWAVASLDPVPPLRSLEPSAAGHLDYVIKSAPFMVTTLVNQLFAGTVLAVVAFMLSEAEVASLALALRFSVLPSLALVVVGYVYVPLLMKGTEIEAAYRSGRRAAAAIGLPIAAALLAATVIAPQQYAGYLPSGDLLVCLLVGQSVAVALGPVGMALVAVGAEQTLAAISVVSVVTLLVAVALATPLWGPIGVAIAVGCGLAVQNLAAYAVYRQHPRKSAQKVAHVAV
jgi:O-antigen/teichoic acid export membrane protein